ncbi:uncharacterized protein LOC123535953 [Mercenaria mercenaria]|uniref:uncharacterized protein LOC123535953 n=1 Tax=Mercenaria mercenaria TaxID=6596 RepID=UPI00234E6753|nr:uncharacterized protein LOC123535953 [Mercenaria mercenaria]
MSVRQICTFVFLLAATSALEVVIQQPTKNGTFDVGIIITPGADIKGEAYEKLGTKFQESFPGRMWVALLCDFPFNIPNPIQLASGIDESISKFKNAGFQGNNIFLAGHSLGGLFVGMYGLSHASQLKGVMLFASYLTRSHRLRDYPLPVLTISGDLDGLTRITRIVDTFEELENETMHNPSPVSLIYKTPVIVMRGLNHGHFASGTMPPNVLEHDLPVDNDITFDNAHQTIAFHVTNFVIVNTGLPKEKYLTAVAGMKMAYFSTKETIQPLSRVKAMDINTGKSSTTTITAQRCLLGNKLASHVDVNDTEISEQEIDFYEPDVKVINRTHAHVQTFSTVVTPFDPEDVSLNPQTPSEVQSVMKSKAGMIKLLPDVAYDGNNLTCRDLNKIIYQVALNASSALAHNRSIERRSPSITFNDDVISDSLLNWSVDSLDLQYGVNGSLKVTSYAYVVDPDDPSGKMAGTRHCKLLSPYRAMEWFYIDSLKRNAGHNSWFHHL